MSLADLITLSPVELLGSNAAGAFDGQLPFLVKVLAVAEPLSIQVHPTAAQALAGFDAEEARNIPRRSSVRHYRDRNHKPELLCALTDFDALCGFRSAAELELLGRSGLPSEIGQRLEQLAHGNSDAAVRALLESWLRLPRTECATLLRALRPCAKGIAEGSSVLAPGFAWIVKILDAYSDDPGVLAALLLRHVHLSAGDALFVNAGILHAYLQGTALEVMANSDNVVRGGLTSKHVDVEGLLDIVGPSSAHAQLVYPSQVGVERIYRAPVTEFRLSRLDIGDRSVTISVASAEILVCADGALTLTSHGDSVTLTPGFAAFVAAVAGEYSIVGPGGGYRVVVPDSN